MWWTETDKTKRDKLLGYMAAYKKEAKKNKNNEKGAANQSGTKKEKSSYTWIWIVLVVAVVVAVCGWFGYSHFKNKEN